MDLSGIDGLDVTGALARLMGNRALYDRVVEQFVFGDLADAASTISRQVHAADLEGAQRTAHSLKGVAGALGATELADRAGALEDCIRAGHAASDVDALRNLVAAELARVVAAVRERIGENSRPSNQHQDVDFTVLPRDVIARMRDALQAGDLEEVEGVAQSFAGEYPDASRRVVKLCAAFDYDALARHLNH